MGITRLGIYLEEHLPSACYLVDISREVDLYKSETGKNPTIVVDMETCEQMNYKSSIDKVQEYINQVRVFVESFKTLDVELVFFLGGIIEPGNYIHRRWLKKQRKSIVKVHRAIDALKAEGSTASDFVFHLPNTRLIRACIIKYVFGCEVKISTNNIRADIIEYVKRHKCFAIFGQNGDFVASQVNTLVLSSKCFVRENMTTKLYDRDEMAHRLGLHVTQLPLLALLTGNNANKDGKDIKDFNKHFYVDDSGRRIPLEHLVPAIADDLRQISANLDIEDTLTYLAQFIFQDSSRAISLRMSYDSYFGAAIIEPPVSIPTPADGWPYILYIADIRYCNNLLPPNAYSVMCRLTFREDASFEDLRNGSRTRTRDLPTSKVLRPLRSRLYGILLFEKKSEDPSVPPVTVQEWCNDDEYSYNTPVVVEPVRPDVHHPGLSTLWGNDDDFNEVRWTLFLTTVAPSVRPSKWQSFDDEVMLSSLSASHLYEREFLNELELDAVLATIATYPLYAGLPSPPREEIHVHARATVITTALSRTFSLVFMVLATCGYPFKLFENNAFLKFDGKVFQIKYVRAVLDNADIKSLCDNNDDCFDSFQRMKEMII